MSEPTSAKTFEDLILAVAIHMGVAFYGATGAEVAQIPTDVFDLAECKRHVNNGIRMFLMDAPPQGWRCMEPLVDVALWPTTKTGVVTVSGVGNLIMTSVSADFYPSMVGHAIVAVTSGTSYTISAYTSSKVVTVTADASADTGDTFKITADGNYTLPATFGGEHKSDITYVAGSNNGQSIGWTSELDIRRYRADDNTSTGTPTKAAVRKMTSLARRWELTVWPTLRSLEEVQFVYDLYFDTLTGLTDLHPAGYKHDETITAACRAAAERDSDDLAGGEMNSYYRSICLPNSYRVDGRSGPRNLGYCGNPGRVRINNLNFRYFQRRPTVAYDTP